MSKPRKSLGQMAAEAANHANGTDDGQLQCPRCGCTDLRTLRSERNAAGDTVQRTKYCRLCGPSGPRLYTSETIQRIANPDEE